MTRTAQPLLSAKGQQALDHYAQVLQHLEDLSPVTIRNYLSDLRQFIAWCEANWNARQEERSFTPQAVAPTLLIRYREYLRTSLGLKPSTVNRTLMSLKRYFAWTRKTQLIQADPASSIKFVPKEATPPRHLSDEEEESLVATVSAAGTLRDQAIITLLLHTSLRAQELCSLTRQQVHLGKRHGTWRILGKRKKVREVPLNSTARSALNQYLETLPQECQYLFPSEKTHRALTGRALGHLVTKYATQALPVIPPPASLFTQPVKYIQTLRPPEPQLYAGKIASVPFSPNPNPHVREVEQVHKEEKIVLGSPSSEEIERLTNTIQRINTDRIPVEWAFIPKGSAMMEKVEPFFISKYPITYKQFQAFIDDNNGYSNDHWWEELAIRFDQPANARWPIPNHPRETVSWYEAIAFCQWLSNKIGRKVTLPTEVQWQRAAQGDDDRDYPWGKVFSKTKCNTSESGIRQTTPVNRYSSDASPYGAVDMCGNVKEWCLNEHTNPTKIDLVGDAPRVLRGGSWKNGRLSARVGDRDFSFPHHRLDNIGFRIVASASRVEEPSSSSLPSLPTNVLI